ncbi:MAG: TlpA family protein disulfide reductase [Syntrophaceae bacterium]|nr:TlpA family protein disulfide reductase [Syntrophaceae bacterium]
MKSLLALAFISLVLLLPLQSGAGTLESPSPAKPVPLKVGNAAPDFKLDTPQGKTISLRSFRGKSVLINFWATWCGPCVDEMHILQQIATEWSSNGLVILGINEGDPASKVTGFIQRYGISFPILMDGDQEVSRLYMVRYMPTSVFVDKDGIVQVVAYGGFDTKESLVSKMLSKVGK